MTARLRKFLGAGVDLILGSTLVLGISLVILIPVVTGLFFLSVFSYSHPVAAIGLVAAIGAAAFAGYKKLSNDSNR